MTTTPEQREWVYNQIGAAAHALGSAEALLIVGLPDERQEQFLFIRKGIGPEWAEVSKLNLIISVLIAHLDDLGGNPRLMLERDDQDPVEIVDYLREVLVNAHKLADMDETQEPGN